MGNSTFKKYLYKGLNRLLIALSLTLITTVLKAQIPIASFTADSTQGCAPLTVHFSNSSILATNYFWDFGNGNTSVLPNPTTVYLTPGNFTVKLIAFNSASNKSDTLTITNYIHTVAFPTANFSAVPLTGCADGLTVTFTNLSVSATNYVWDFGDGTASNLVTPTHTYNNPGVYSVKLIAYTAYGCNHVITKPSYITVRPKPVAAISVNQTSSCNQAQVFSFSCPSTGISSYQWNFGQPSSGVNNVSTLATPTHVYNNPGTYTVSLIVINQYGCSDTVVMPNYISIGNTLVPSFTASDSSGCAPFTTTFTCTVPNATSYTWNFGDPASGALNTASTQSPSHTFNNSGAYNVSLSVTTAGCNGSVTIPQLITVDNLPSANFSVSSANYCAPATVQFTNTSTGAAGGYLWEFGDGNTSTLANPTNVYSTPGTYTVTLHTYSVNGCEATIIKTNIVTINGANINFSASPTAGCANLLTNFSSHVVVGISSFQWNFGDPASGALNTSTIPNPSHNYASVGSYTVSLIITTSNGCKDTMVKTNHINVYPSSVTYTLPDTIEGCQPFPVSFTDPLMGSSMWHWDFGIPWLTNDTSNVKNPSYVFDSAGVYTVTLVSNMQGNGGNGCSQTFAPVAIIKVLPLILAPITYVVATPCSPFTVHFSDTTQNVVHWSWNFGDGSPLDTNQFPTHIYQQPGVYQVTLQVETVNGCIASTGTTVTLGIPNPINVSSHLSCASDTLQFGITGVGQFSSYTWNFGDGSSTTNIASPKHCYSQGGIFIVTLSATSTTGCNYVYTDTITTELLIPSFVINGLTEKCNSLYVTFTNTSTGGLSYLWDFNDIFSPTDTSTAFSPTYFFHNIGIYDVTLTVYGQVCAVTKTFPATIKINKALPTFSFTQSSNCFPMTVQFTDLTTNPGATSWNWNFGNGQTSTLQNPVITYTAPPAGNISLNVIDSNGCAGVKSKPNIFFLEAHLATSDTGGCRPYTVSFSDSSDSSAVSWQWFFGDGTTSALQNPTHTYLQDSLYTVTLVTTFASGCMDTIVMPGLINVSSPHANFTSAAQAGCAPVLAQFNNTSTNGVTYLWDFGDGITSSNNSPSHVYNIPGYYTVTLIAYNGGCADTTVKADYIYIPGTYSYFTLTSTLNCLGNYTCFIDSSLNATSWQWNFGDGYTDTIQNPCHLYSDTGSYIVSLIAYDSLGCQSFYTFPSLIDIHPNAVAAGTVSDTLGCNALTASFNESAIYEVSYEWHFGDGDTSTSANPTHTYQSAGIYYPYLIAFNPNGCSDTSATLGPVHVVQTPNAQFTPTAFSGCTVLNTTMQNTSTDTTVSVYNWTLGNGTSSVATSPIAVYPDSGIYTVTLIVTNEGLCSDTISQQITVHLTPTANASTLDTLGCSPYNVTFNNTSVYATNYEWHFGDGQISTNASPTHTYTAGGVYTVYLVAINQFGCSDTFYFTSPITVLQTPAAQFSANTLTGCTPLNIQLNNQSTDTINVSYNWIFGNGSTSTSINPSAVYPDSGLFNIELIALNANGCADTATQTATIHLTPTAIASTSDTVGCSPLSVTFSNNSIYATQFNWNFGDNNASTVASPVHSYVIGGVYYPTLSVNNQFGCSDTLSFTQPITVLQTPNALFTTNTNAGCTPLFVITNNQTTDTISATYNWNFGNSQTSNAFNPTVTYTDSSLHNLSLIVSNSNGCADTANTTIDVHLSPTAIANTTDTSGCSPYQVIFNNNSINANSYIWNFGNGQTSTDPSPFYTYTSGGNYQVTLIATNNFGCSDTLILSPTINVKQSPTAAFSVAQAAQCSGSTFNFQNTSSNLSNPGYNWLIGTNDTSTSANPSIALLSPGFYSVSLTVTNDNGCADSLTQINYLQVFDTLPPMADPILSVSVLNNTQTEITWANSAALDLGSYKVWRFDVSSGNYINVYTDNNPVNGSFNPDSKYTDVGLNTLQNTYTYKVQTLDRCAYAIPLSSLIPHTTVNVTARTDATNIKVQWTPYIGCAVNTYEINRVEVSNGSSVLVGTVPGIITEFTDTTLDCPIEYSYKITATDLCGNPYQSLSDTSIAIPENELANQQAIMSHSTVVQNNYVLTEWAEPQLAPNRVNGYNILRSKDTTSTNYTLIATLPSNAREYEDYDVDVMEQNYYYKVEVINDCNLTGIPSTNSSSILLQSRWMYTHSTLWWTEYDKWDSGVDKYEIEKFNWDTQQWELIKTVPGNQTSTDVGE